LDTHIPSTTQSTTSASPSNKATARPSTSTIAPPTSTIGSPKPSDPNQQLNSNNTFSGSSDDAVKIAVPTTTIIAAVMAGILVMYFRHRNSQNKVQKINNEVGVFPSEPPPGTVTTPSSIEDRSIEDINFSISTTPAPNPTSVEVGNPLTPPPPFIKDRGSQH
jgi:hypothetical protein